MRLLRMATVAASVLIFAGVLERLGAAMWQQLKFGFDSKSPIYLNADTLLLFSTLTPFLCLTKIIWMWQEKMVRNASLMWAIALDLNSLAIIGWMLLIGFARIQ